jgi:hypothetical protein
VLGAVVALLLPAAAPTASAEEPADPSAPGAAVVQVCAASPVPALPVLGPGLCKSVDTAAVLAAIACGKLGVDPPICDELTDGRPTDPAAVDGFEHSWVHRALALQERLSFGQPLLNTLLPHTHNSFNAATEWPTLTTSDPNQRYSMTDQLRLGIRVIELDVHFLPNPAGDPAQGLRAPVLCHGETTDVGPLRIHVGCSVDRLLSDGLAELRAWLAAPANAHEAIVIYLQNELDGDPAAHAAAVAELERGLGDLVERPTGTAPGHCADLPLDRSLDDVLAGGHRVLLVGNCGPGAWSSWVFERGSGWDERGNSDGYPSYPACLADRQARGYDSHLIRVYEDSTWLSAISGSPAPVSAAEVRSMVRCGVDVVGLDRVGPADPRLAALVWSWAPDEPSAAGSCARWDGDARFFATPCGQSRRPACRTAGGGWVVPEPTVAFAGAAAACRAAGATFDVPRTGWDDEQLRLVARSAGAAGVWVAYADAGTGTGWQPGAVAPAAPAAAEGPDTVAPPPRPQLPATGGTGHGLPWAALALALTLVPAVARPLPRARK